MRIFILAIIETLNSHSVKSSLNSLFKFFTHLFEISEDAHPSKIIFEIFIKLHFKNNLYFVISLLVYLSTRQKKMPCLNVHHHWRAPKHFLRKCLLGAKIIQNLGRERLIFFWEKF